MATVTYKIGFEDKVDPRDRVSVILGSAKPDVIPVTTKTDYVFEADDNSSDTPLGGFQFSLMFLPPPRPGTITNLQTNGRRATFTASVSTCGYEYFVVVEAFKGNTRGSTIAGRKPIIRNACQVMIRGLICAVAGAAAAAAITALYCFSMQ